MTQVTIHTSVEDGHAVSRWSCGARTGVLWAPTVGHVTEAPLLANELLALSHLLVRMSLIGNDRNSREVSFRTSVPGLIDAVRQPKAQSVALRLYSRALRVRFGDAAYEGPVDIPVALLPGAGETRLTSSTPVDWLLGVRQQSVAITEHAVRRVQERHNFQSNGHAYRHIRRWSKHELRDVELPPAVRTEKLRRYGSEALIVADDVGWHGVIVNKTLVTMFFRRP